MKNRTRGKEVKGKSKKDKPCMIYIFAEGETEEIYLNHYENYKEGIHVIPVDTDHTDALGIVKEAKKYIEDLGKEFDVGLGDRCYCVFDSDPKSNIKIKEAFDIIRGNKHKGFECIFSNPSFEIWFILHFRKAPYGLNATQMKAKLKDIVKEKFPDYKETVDIYDYLLDKRDNAIKEAKLLHQDQKEVHKDVFSHECNPYTNMFEFLDYLVEVKKK